MAESGSARNFEAVLEQHHRLRELLSAIETRLVEQSGTFEEVCGLLAKLGDQLVKHFATEEEGGYFSEALEHAPRLFERANALMAQHPLMLREAKALADLAPGGGDPAAIEKWWAETRSRFLAFKAELMRHEHHENVVLQEAFHTDIGHLD